jgi:catechol 2,3-dioxygenase-like lactoylglutathione lyase family enzyme
MNIVRTIPDVRSLNMPASRAFYEGILGFNVGMEHAGMIIFASATQPKQQVTVNADAADAMPLPPGFAVDVGFPESLARFTIAPSRRAAQSSSRWKISRSGYGDFPYWTRMERESQLWLT